MIDLQTRLQNALGERYSIERPLGSGGAGVVFLAEDLKHFRRFCQHKLVLARLDVSARQHTPE